MRTTLGSSGGTSRPFLRAAIFSLLILAAFSLTPPQTANAQIWVSSGFRVAPDNVQEIAYCNTSAADPSTLALTPAAADYNQFAAACKVTPSTGSVITSTECPTGDPFNNPTGSPATGNPTGECDILFTPQPGVTYTINSTHALWFNIDPYGTSCGQWENTTCFSDPLGYYSMNPSASNPWPAEPVYSSDQTSVSTDEPCSAVGTCSPQGVPTEYCVSSFTLFGISFCTNAIDYDEPIWFLAKSSAQYTTCNIPEEAETPGFQGWDTAQIESTVGMWKQTLSDWNGDSFSNYQVQETAAADGEDTCYYDNPNYPGVTPMNSITGGDWDVGGDNTWGPDYVGWLESGVSYYRASERVPCGFTIYQQMQIMCSDNSWHNYGLVNTLQGSMSATTVTSVRAGGTATRRY
jgi:hypothetical protein